MPSRRFVPAGIIALAFALLTGASAPSSFWTRPASWYALVVIAIAGLTLISVGISGRAEPRRCYLAQAAGGLLIGFLLNPSTGAIVAIMIGGLVLSSVSRRRPWPSLLAIGAGVLIGLALQAMPVS